MTPIIPDEKLQELLTPFNGAIPIYERVVNYFGASFEIREQEPAFSESMQRINLSNLTFSILVQLNSGSSAASLTHELLHLDLYIRGFPMFHSCAVRRWLHHYADMHNQLHHSIFFKDFGDCGFDMGVFLVNADTDFTGEQLEDFKQNKPYQRGDVALWYLYDLIAEEAGAPHYSAKLRQEVTALKPDLDATFQYVDGWFQSKRFHDPSKLAGEVNNMLEEVGLPAVNYVSLKNTDGKIMAEPVI